MAPPSGCPSGRSCSGQPSGPPRRRSRAARVLGAALLLGAALALSACDGPQERAEAHRVRAVELLAAGEPERAAIEFRNALRLDPANAAARLAFARMLRDGGDDAGALGQYAALVDQDRANLDGHRELAELALAAGDLETAGSSLRQGLALAPDDLRLRALEAARAYRLEEGRAAAVAAAAAVVAAAPGETHAQMVLIADRMNAGDAAGALAQADAALAATPGDLGLHLVRLAALETLGDPAAVGAQVERMAALFPDDPGVSEALVHWRMSQGDLAGAEAALRARAAAAPGDPAPALAVAQFLYDTAGAAAAGAELDRLAAAAADPLPFRRARADLDFTEGRTAAAIAALRALLDGAEASDATREIQVDLAGMLDATGDAAGRDALVEAVLAEDPGQVAALKLRARAATAADRPEQAVQDMRTALAGAPRDPEIMTILAAAHLREGARALAGERLALAVELSGQAPAESLRYASFLTEEGRLAPAEAVLADALRRAPADPGLLGALGETQAARGDWPGVERTAAALRALGDPEAARRAEGLELASLEGQGLGETARDRLRARAASDPAALARLVEDLAAEGDFAAAQAALDPVLAADPAGIAPRALQAGLWAAQGETDRAVALYRALAAEAPALPEPHRALAALLLAAGRGAEADAAIAAGLAATGGDADLRLMQAGRLETAGDFEGAIAAYEALYALDGDDLVVANNLASLLSTRRDDDASLARAFAIARRLQGAETPQFQDTLGWILHRRGDSAGALALLEPAAAALPGDALAQYHLGEAQAALGLKEAARESLGRALALAAADPVLAAAPQMAAARARLADLDAAGAAGGTAAPAE